MSEEAEIRSCWDLPPRYLLTRDFLIIRLWERIPAMDPDSFEQLTAGRQAELLAYCDIRERQEAAARSMESPLG